MPKTKTIQVNYLARVEGEGGLYVKVRGNTVTDVQLRIFEPPRFFEALLR
ncbi:MAG TPA: Ni/Fe hydrogenase subunit alpha, partial [Chloroflexia bacterium]|nr:Ni/Fe hydrogenase subunit alpha [Chloroflexia bacterium]